ncbi:MAG: hypothetical protein JWO27_2929 [Frankiales bacterium]|nr:hypothetical protein [Frankiales bacterium]
MVDVRSEAADLWIADNEGRPALRLCFRNPAAHTTLDVVSPHDVARSQMSSEALAAGFLTT